MKIFSLLADRIKSTFRKNKPQAQDPLNESNADVAMPGKDRTSTMHITQAYVETMTHAIVKQLEYLEKTNAAEHLASRSVEQQAPSQTDVLPPVEIEAQYNQKIEQKVKTIKTKQSSERKELLESYQDNFHRQKQSFQQYMQGQLETINQLKQEKHKHISTYQKLKNDYDSCLKRLNDLKDEHQKLKDNLNTLGSSSSPEDAINVRTQKHTEAQVIAFEKVQKLKSVRQQLEQQLTENSSLEQQLQEELESLQLEANKLKTNSADQLTSRLKMLGIVGVSYQPKEGHLTIAADELQSFVQDPGAFAVSHSGISESTYKAWQAHCKSPRCTAILADGSICGSTIDTVTDPLRFVLGISDRCTIHKRKGYTAQKN